MAVTLKLTTARSVDALTPRAERYAVADAKVAGLALRISPDGTRVWALRYRNASGEQCRLRLGGYPRLSLAKARMTANRELRAVDGGVDPQAERRGVKHRAAQAKKDSIEALAADYIERHAKPRKRTWKADDSKLRVEILPMWKGKPVTSITRRDCRELVQAIADRGAPIVANRVVALLSRLFRHAVDQGVIDVNPAAQLPKPGVEIGARPEEDREVKPYDADEIRSIWAATETLAPAPRALYRLGLLTGQRPGEIGDMAWAEVEQPWWTIPAGRSKNRKAHRVYLTRLALDALHGVTPAKDEPLVFAGYRGKRQVAAMNLIVFADVRRRLMPRHAMRDTVATGLAAAGVRVEDIAHVLNHSYGPRVTGGYNAHHYDAERRRALEGWAAALDAIVDHPPKVERKVLRHRPKVVPA